MKALVTGGRGTLGRLLVPRLRAAGVDVAVTSRRPVSPKDEVEVRRLDLRSKEGLAECVRDVEVVVHAASNPARTRAVDVTGTEALVEAAAAAGVGHVVYPSIVGIDDHPLPYYRAKVAAERILERGQVPTTILRTTQFHEFLDRIFRTGPVVVALRGVDFQLIDGGVVADHLVDIVQAGPQGRVDDIGGPRAERMDYLARTWRRATGARKPLVRIPVAGKAAAAFKAGRHHTPNRLTATPGWDEWLQSRYG